MSRILLPIHRRYLICLNVACYRGAAGTHYLDPLWHRDVSQHVRYLKNLMLASPCRAGVPPAEAIAWTSAEMRFLDLPEANNMMQAVLHLPRVAVRLWRAVGWAEIVHFGVAGWPIPFGWLASPMAVLRGRPSVVVVESAPWRLAPGLPATLKNRIKAGLWETLGRWCVNHASLVIVTQDEYRKSFLRDAGRGHIIHASWLDSDTVLSREDAVQSWGAKRLRTGRCLRILFAGRLERSKGVMVLLEAMRILAREGAAVQLDLLGRGELEAPCEQACREMPGHITMLGTLPYGEEFFELLRGYHAVVVPSLSDEQPRIVYDAFSQAVGVLAGDTAGLRDCVEHGKTGLIARSRSAEDWAELIRGVLPHVDQLEEMGMAALEVARAMTHEEMHRRRWQLLAEMPINRQV